MTKGTTRAVPLTTALAAAVLVPRDEPPADTATPEPSPPDDDAPSWDDFSPHADWFGSDLT